MKIPLLRLYRELLRDPVDFAVTNGEKRAEETGDAVVPELLPKKKKR